MEGRRMVKAVLLYKRTRLTCEANKLNFFLRHRLFSVGTLCSFSEVGEDLGRTEASCLETKVVILSSHRQLSEARQLRHFLIPKITSAPQFGVYCREFRELASRKEK